MADPKKKKTLLSKSTKDDEVRVTAPRDFKHQFHVDLNNATSLEKFSQLEQQAQQNQALRASTKQTDPKSPPSLRQRTTTGKNKTGQVRIEFNTIITVVTNF